LVSAETLPQQKQPFIFEQVFQIKALFLAVIIASIMILQGRQKGVHGKTAKHLSTETREGIMKEFSCTEKIEMDLSARLVQSKTTMIVHL